MPDQKPQIVPMSQEHRDEAILLWQLHDMLLQNYRTLFLTFQAIALTGGGLVSFQVSGGFVWDLLHISVIVFLILAGPVFILVIWLPIVSHRHRMVSFAQWLLRTNHSLKTSPFDLMGEFGAEKSEYHKTISAREDYQALLKGPTRMKLDRAIPYAFMLFWALLLLWKLLGAT
jgi:hypothetical protein